MEELTKNWNSQLVIYDLSKTFEKWKGPGICYSLIDFS
jgi:hypothetical protein